MKSIRNSLAAILGLLLLANNSFAVTGWTNQLGGALNDGVNWNTGVAPVSGEEMKFYEPAGSSLPNGLTLNLTLNANLTAGSWNDGYGRNVWNLDLAGFNLDLASGNNSGWTTTVSDQHSTNTVTSSSGIGNVFARGLFLAGWNSLSLLEVKGANTRFTIQTGTGDRVIQGTNRNSTAFDPGAWFKVSGGSMVTNKDAGYLVGSAAGTHGGIYLTDAGTVHYATNGATLYLGGYNAQASYAHNVASIGDLIITNGAKWIMGQSASALTMGREFGTIGNLKITGSGSAFTNRQDGAGTARNFLGGKGQATILIENGGSMGTPEGSYIGRGNVGGGAFDATAKTVMTIRDAGSTYVSGYWGGAIGGQGTGLVYVANGGKFTANGGGAGALLGIGIDNSYTGNGTNYAAYGLLSVSNATSSAVVRNLTIGDKGTGKAEVMDGALLQVTGLATNSSILMGRGNLTISDASVTSVGGLTTSGTNSIAIEIGSKAHGLYYMTLAGDLTLGAAGADVTTLNITTAGDYVSAGFGSTIKLIDYNVKSGVFANIADGGVFVAAGDEFQLIYGAGDTYLTVIPEPASILLLLSGIVGAYKLRRRS